MKLDVSQLRYMTREEFRVLTAIELGMKNHEFVPTQLIESLAKLTRGGTFKAIIQVHKNKLVYHDRKKCAWRRFRGVLYWAAAIDVFFFFASEDDGYKLTYSGYDYLALKALCIRGSVVGVGNQIGVGKEAGTCNATLSLSSSSPDDLRQMSFLQLMIRTTSSWSSCIDLDAFRSGRLRISVITCCTERAPLGCTNCDSFLFCLCVSFLTPECSYLSRLAALKEYAYMKALYDNGFPVPQPMDVSRHCIVMKRIPAYPLYAHLFIHSFQW